MKNWIRAQFRKRSRVYILPTKMGGYLNGLIFLMFLLSIGYGNNLLLIFTTFLFAFDLLWLVQTHFHLYRLKFDQLNILSGHAGQPIAVSVFWEKAPLGPWNWEIELEGERGTYKIEAAHHMSTKSEGEISPTLRGLYHWNYIKIKTINPFGLYQSWIYFPLKQDSLVYPTLLKNVDLPLSGNDFEGELAQDKKGHDDFRGLAKYANDESRKISWKHYARSGTLVVKEGEEKKTPLLQLDLKLPQDQTLKENYVSYLTTQLVECHRRDIPFVLRVNNEESSQLSDCLKVLSLC
jgi:uncharacterized protein (DUF58 family)